MKDGSIARERHGNAVGATRHLPEHEEAAHASLDRLAHALRDWKQSEAQSGAIGSSQKQSEALRSNQSSQK